MPSNLYICQNFSWWLHKFHNVRDKALSLGCLKQRNVFLTFSYRVLFLYQKQRIVILESSASFLHYLNGNMFPHIFSVFFLNFTMALSMHKWDFIVYRISQCFCHKLEPYCGKFKIFRGIFVFNFLNSLVHTLFSGYLLCMCSW